MAKRTTKKSSGSEPWKKPNPKRKSTKLTAKSKTSAKKSASKAGRKYPSLVDNMNAAKKQKKSGKSS